MLYVLRVFDIILRYNENITSISLVLGSCYITYFSIILSLLSSRVLDREYNK